ncbi:hypothetical protein D3C72_1549020 [compost metagenome]
MPAGAAGAACTTLRMQRCLARGTAQSACQARANGIYIAAWGHQNHGGPSHAVLRVPDLRGHHTAGMHAGGTGRGNACRPSQGERLRCRTHAARRLRDRRARAPDAPSSGLRHRQRDGCRPAGAGHRGSGAAHAVLLFAALPPTRHQRPAARAAGGADVRPLCHAVARHGADHAGRPRRLYHRLAQSARYPVAGRALRLR